MSELSAYLSEVQSTVVVDPALPPSRPQPGAGSICSPDCPVCHGLGWVRRELPVTDPNFGRLSLCPNADWTALHDSGLDEVSRTYSWSAVMPHGNTQAAIDAVRSVIAGGGWVYLWGGFGTAKTLLLQIAVAESLRRRTEAAYVRLVEIFDHMRLAYDEADPNTQSMKRMDYWTSVRVLCIDEFDKTRGTAYESDRRFLLMDRRYQDGVRQKTSTIIASNEPPERLAGYLADRVLDGRFRVVNLTGESMRPNMRRRDA